MTKGNYTITYNGEVYNYPDLRNVLLGAQPDLKLDSTTDTEILIRTLERAIEAHGDQKGFPNISPVLNTYNGFFGFGLWDEKRQRLLLVRDRYGIKPVYYYHEKDQFLAFASEVETILASRIIAKPSVNLDILTLFCTMSTFFTQTTDTLVQGVKSLKQGHYLWVDVSTGQVEDFEFYSLPSEDPALANLTQEEAVAEMKHILEDAIQLRMVSDVPLSTFLSGGIDSSVITAIASHSAAINSKEASSENIHSPDHPEYVSSSKAISAFTVTYLGAGQNPGAAADEEFSRKVSTHLGPSLVNHKFVEVDPMTFTLDDIDELSDMGTFADDDRMLTILMNYRAVKKEGFDVILNGQGADEAMGGYIAGGWFRAGMVDVANPDVPLFDKVLDLVLDTKLFTDRIKDYVPKTRAHFDASIAQYKGTPYERSIKWLFGTSLHRILRFEDFLSMRSAVECRVPILDYRLVDFSFRLPMRLHLRPSDYYGKIVLRELSKAYLPLDVCERPKQQFPNVNPEALNKRLKEIILENLTEISECPIVKYIWLPQMFATPEGLDMCYGADFWLAVVYWRWWKKFAGYGGVMPAF